MNGYESVIKIGVHVNIPRTNGQIQSASISDIHLIPNVSVEWLEDDDIMGKEVELKELNQLNPELDERFSVGDHVLIKRRDGRVHFAYVTDVHTGPSVSVEWREDGETLGKYVDLDLIKELNPKLFQNRK